MAKFTERTFTCSECGRTYEDHPGLHKWNSNYHDSFIRCRVDGAVCMEDKESKTEETEVEETEELEGSDSEETIRPGTPVDEEDK